MKMELDRSTGSLTIREVYAGLLLQTEEGNEISICMRDDTFEINVMPGGKHTSNWWRVDMQKGTVDRLAPEPEDPLPPANPDSGD